MPCRIGVWARSLSWLCGDRRRDDRRTGPPRTPTRPSRALENYMSAEWITAAEAAQRLGVKPASLYSYVSRGVLNRRRAAGSRTSLFSASEVEGLARRGRPRRAPGPTELWIETQVTEISGDHLRYRGHDAIALARQRSFEDGARLLWTGSLGQPWGPAGSWQATAAATAGA